MIEQITLDNAEEWLMRAAEHLITDDTQVPPAEPFGIVPVNTWSAGLAEIWTRDVMRSKIYTTIIETNKQGFPTFPRLTTLPTAGERQGEKQELYSRAFDIGTDTGVYKINSTLYLNVSDSAIDAGLKPICDAIMRSAVAYDAHRQIVEAIETRAPGYTTLDAALGHFDGSRFHPNFIIVRPSQLLSKTQNVGIRTELLLVMMDSQVSNALVINRQAVLGWYRMMQMETHDPSVMGVDIAYMITGRLSIDPTGVAKTTV